MSNVRLRGVGSYADSFARFRAVGMEPAAFRSAYGRPAPDPATCLSIQCGAISQEEAGPELLRDCALAGYSGVRSWTDPLCAPRMGRTAAAVARVAGPLPVGEKAAAMFLDPLPDTCGRGVYSEIEAVYADELAACDCGVVGAIAAHPLLAVGVVALAGLAIWKVRR